jgi:Flp pilus assembly protein TadG
MRKVCVNPSLVGVFGFLALAIDLGLIMVARNQCQAAADSAAMAGTRTLNGDPTTTNNSANAGTAATNAAAANQVLSQQVPAAGVTVNVGSYTYDPTQQLFVVNIPKNANDNANLLQATVTWTGPTAFARVFGVNSFSVTASATAAHRPRDVALILDFSGSMRFGSLLGLPYVGSRTASNNPESVFPQFGHWSAATLQQTASTYDSSGNAFDPCNFTESDTANNNRPVIVQDFYQSVGTSPVAAFLAAPGGYATLPNGDNMPHANFDAGSNWATDVADFVGSTKRNDKFETQGYDGLKIGGRSYSGYTCGPGYWGKTFFIWPPDPRSTKDWRQRFFIDAGSGQPVTLNVRLYDSGGNWQAPGSSSYKINYAAILQWLATLPNPFPSQLVAGRITYYTAIPSGTDTTLNNRFWTQYPLSSTNERFWKDYIDYVLGLRQTGASSWEVITPQTGYGDDFSWGTTQINTSFNPGNDGRYMDYTDNPRRPQTHFWFGPMSLVDFLSNFNLWYDHTPIGTQYCWMPGTAHESPLYPCKLGIQAALQDAQNNHPNDRLSLIMFSTPQASANDTAGGRFNRARAPLGRNYQRMTDSLWFPPYTIDNPGTTITPYDYTNNLEVPRAIRVHADFSHRRSRRCER